MVTITSAAAEGVEAFAMVHDSYGTLAADCDVLARCTRQAFVRLYTHQDVSALLHEQFAAQCGAQSDLLPMRPPLGTLDVASVLASDYFFA